MKKLNVNQFLKVCGPKATWSKSTLAACDVMVLGVSYRAAAGTYDISTQAVSQRMCRIQQLLA
jgi:hypothetical protein